MLLCLNKLALLNYQARETFISRPLPKDVGVLVFNLSKNKNETQTEKQKDGNYPQ